MRRVAPVLLSMLLLTGLGACNILITAEPLFTEADGPAPALRNGLWLVEQDPKKPCRVDVRRPVARWPRCADWTVVQDGRMLRLAKDESGAATWEIQRYIAVAGDPQILQFKVADDEAPGEATPGAKPSGPMYVYTALNPTRTDADGKVVAFESWPVMCGPTPSDAAKNERNRYLTEQLQPGFVEMDQNCTTTSKEAVRAAAAAGRTWNGEPGVNRWIRDTYP